MQKNKIKSINQQQSGELPSNLQPIDSSNTVRIPIIDRFYEIDGELYFQIAGDSTPRKWKNYSHMDFN